jgi:hypothetical protein
MYTAEMGFGTAARHPGIIGGLASLVVGDRL